MDINEEAKKILIKLYTKYTEGDIKEAIKLAEQVYEEFGAAEGTLLSKDVSEGVIYAGKLWTENKIPKEVAKRVLKKLKKDEERKDE